MVCVRKGKKCCCSFFVVEDNNAIVPGECDVGDLRALFSYFQYRAPNIDSLSSPILDEGAHQKTLELMLKKNSLFAFCAHNLKTEDELVKLNLSGNVLCSQCKRFLCKRSGHNSKRVPTRKETDLECLLRHLRNAIAHGHVYIIHGGNHISALFEDRNSDKRITARIICCQADLRKWRCILESAVQGQRI